MKEPSWKGVATGFGILLQELVKEEGKTLLQRLGIAGKYLGQLFGAGIQPQKLQSS